MDNFASSEELKNVLGGFFVEFVERYSEGISEYAKPGKALNDTNLVVHFDLKDPNLLIVIDCEQKPINVSFDGENPKSPTAVFYVSAENGHKFWLGGLNIPNALVKKQVVLKGPVRRLLKVIPITKQVYPLYDRYLVEHGYDRFRLK